MSLKKNNVIDEYTRILPEKIDLLIRAIEYDFTFYGFHMPSIIQARNYGVRQNIKKAYSSLQSYGTIELITLTSRDFSSKVNLKIQKSGTMNALELKTDIYLAGKKYAGTSDMNIPIIIPIKPRKVKAGETITFHISYPMGTGLSNVNIM